MELRLGQIRILAFAVNMTLLCCCVMPAPLRAFEIIQPDLDLNARVLELEGEGPSLIEGTLVFKNLPNKSEQCFYLAYEDSDYPHNLPSLARFVSNTQQRTSSAYLRSGFMEVSLPSDSKFQLEYLNASVIKIHPKQTGQFADLELAFRSSPKTVNQKTHDLALFDFFYPVPLNDCNLPLTEETLSGKILALPLNFHINYPENYHFAGMGSGESKPGAAHSQLLNGYSTAPRFAFALLNSNFQQQVYPIGDNLLRVYYRHENFADLAPKAHSLFATMLAGNGPLPWSSVDIIESDYLERDDIPGLILMSYPPQKVLANLQFHATNWGLWNLSVRLARQWWGSMVMAENYDNEWLNLGLSDWSAQQALAKLPGVDALELFNDDLRFLSLTHTQYLNMVAATLNRQDPHSYLFDFTQNINRDASLQAPTLYIKQTFAMRYLTAELGEASTQDFLRSFLKQHSQQSITSKDFLAHFDEQPSSIPAKELASAKAELSHYWETIGFPDFSLDAWSSKRGASREPGVEQWLTKIDFSVVNHNGLKIPIRLIDSERNQIHLMVEPSSNVPGDSFSQSIQDIISANQIKKVVFDPDYLFFDPDRFDNTSALPTVHFLPGNLRTLSDHHYSVLWLPYFFRRPGEPFSLGSGFSTMKYIRPILFGSLEYAPSDKTTAYSLSSQQKPQILRGMAAEIEVAKNYENTQSAGLSISQSPLIQALPLLSMNLNLTHQRQLGAPKSAHFLSGLGLVIDSKNFLRNCGVSLAGKQEISPKLAQQDFSYSRGHAQLSTECLFLKNFAFRTKQYYGLMRGSGEIPETAAFKINDLQGPGHRIDIRNLPRLRDIFSTTQDLYAPIPFIERGSGFLLLNRLKLRAFYDLAFSPKAAHSLYRAAGSGITLPFGGGVSGVGDLAVLRFSALAVLYAATPEEIQRRPSFLFDFSGDL